MMLLASIQSLVRPIPLSLQLQCRWNHTILLCFYILFYTTVDDLKVGAGDWCPWVAWTARGSTEVRFVSPREEEKHWGWVDFQFYQPGPVCKFKLVCRTLALPFLLNVIGLRRLALQGAAVVWPRRHILRVCPVNTNQYFRDEFQTKTSRFHWALVEMQLKKISSQVVPGWSLVLFNTLCET